MSLTSEVGFGKVMSLTFPGLKSGANTAFPSSPTGME